MAQQTSARQHGSCLVPEAGAVPGAPWLLYSWLGAWPRLLGLDLHNAVGGFCSSQPFGSNPFTLCPDKTFHSGHCIFADESTQCSWLLIDPSPTPIMSTEDGSVHLGTHGVIGKASTPPEERVTHLEGIYCITV